MKDELVLYLTKEDFYTEYNQKDQLLINEQNKFKLNKYNTLYNLGFFDENKKFSSSLNFLIKTTKYFINLIILNPLIEFEKEKIEISLNENDFYEITKNMPFLLNEHFLSLFWFEKLFQNIINEFKIEIEESKQSVKEYITYKSNNLSVASRIYFHLVESKNIDKPFAFMATYSKKDNKKSVLHTPLKEALIEFKEDNDKLLYLLSSVSKVSEKSNLINNLMKTGELFHPIYFDTEEAYQFLKEVYLYEQSGILCRIPKWFKKKNKVNLKLNLKKKNTLSITTLIQYTPTFNFDGDLTKEEMLFLIENSEKLILFKNKWIIPNEKKLKEMIEAFEILNNNSDITLFDLLSIEFNANKFFNVKNVEIIISQEEWYAEFKKQLNNPNLIENKEISKNFKGTLRNYQQKGYNWLYTMLEYGFGACLADDMGLGKTIQVIAIITKLMETDNKVLLVVPASLIMNWVKEFSKFSSIKPIIIHNQVGVRLENLIIENNVYITTYKMASNLISNKFDLLVLDEAQAIKNIATKQTNDIKLIESKYKFALTGTPIENDLGDLYSLFDFLNKGLLGSKREFVNQTNDMIENNNYEKIRNLIKPFILRRLKSDKSIISDLPDKIEINEYSILTKTQNILYENEVKKLENILKSDEIPKGIVLNAIMKFKQICNHSSQFSNDNIYDENNSGKYEVLRRIATTVKENNEKLIVFTQFKEMTEPLNNFLFSIFQKNGFVLHGSTSIKQRDRMVNEFNNDPIPYMILSLKAGGTGLNLTSSNHVVHFDRWWNPAVENQATDRAYRIGQTKNVFVYKLITKGTIEEKIDDLLIKKKKLSDNILENANESWISKLTKDELLNLFRLEK